MSDVPAYEGWNWWTPEKDGDTFIMSGGDYSLPGPDNKWFQIVGGLGSIVLRVEVEVTVSDTTTPDQRRKPSWFEEWQWCLTHESYRNFKHQARCQVAWGDPFVEKRCEYKGGRWGNDE